MARRGAVLKIAIKIANRYNMAAYVYREIDTITHPWAANGRTGTRALAHMKGLFNAHLIIIDNCVKQSRSMYLN